MAGPSKITDIQEKPVSIGDLPPPPSRDQILGNIEKMKEKYKQQVNDFSKSMEQQKRDAEDKLQKMLAKYKQRDEQVQP